MTSPGATLAASGTLSRPPASERERLAGAARQFEAIFVRQMLAAARKSHFGDDILGGQGLDTFRQMQDEHFADLAAERGAFGLAGMIEKQLAARIAAPSSAATLEGG